MNVKCFFGFHDYTITECLGNFQAVHGDYLGRQYGVFTLFKCASCGRLQTILMWNENEIKLKIPEPPRLDG